MSEVLTIKAGAKRSFDAMDRENLAMSCQQRRISFLAPESEIKKAKRTGGGGSATAGDFNAVMKRLRTEACQQMFESPEKRHEVINRHVTRRRVKSTSVDSMYSLEDVKEMVRKILNDRESQLSEEFHDILCKSLDEQAEHFVKYSESYISRHFRNSTEVSYVS